MNFTSFQDLDTLISDIPADSIVSRTIFDDDHLKAVLFGFAPGQELSEHTSSHPAILHFVRGEASLTLGEERKEAQENFWVHMAARLPHSIEARTTVIMLLLMMKA